MTVTLQIPGALRPFTGQKRELSVEGTTAGEALAALAGQYPDIKNHLYENGELRSFINVYKNGVNIKTLQGLDTALEDGNILMLVPAIAGGLA